MPVEHDIETTPDASAEDITMEADPLTLDLDDRTLVNVIDKRIQDARQWYKENKDLYNRQERNVDYLMGRQLPDEEKMKIYEARYMDNLIYESEAYIKPIALSRLPDLIVKPAKNIEESKQAAKDITEVINSDLRKRNNRQVLSLSFRHHPAYFIGAIKARWDPQVGKHGDYCFEVVHPDNLVLDPVPSNDPNDMQFVAQKVPITVKEVLMRFPDKKEELLQELFNDMSVDFVAGDENRESRLATKIDIWEIWFTWYEEQEDDSFSRIEGVAWKFKKLLLKKMKNPNWDWQGEERMFKHETAMSEEDRERGQQEQNEPTQQQVTQEELMQMVLTGQPIEGLQRERIFNNHFENPRKPYIFLNYDLWGEMPYDETSRIEQNIYLQDNVNKRGKQITEMADRAKGTHVFSADGGLKKEDIEELDLGDPETDLYTKGDLRQVYTHIQPPLPSAALFNEQELSRSKVFAKMGVNDTTRGEVTTDTATTSQIAREADFGRIDDLTEETVNYAAEQMANWAMQFIKLRYTADHFRKIVGRTGETTFMQVNRDLIEDGMEVEVHASGVDKVLRKREAFERARLQMTDPLTFFEDTDAPDPKQRTERLLDFLIDLQTYQLKHVEGMENTQQMVQALGQQPVPGAGGAEGAGQGAQQAVMDLAQIQQGQVPNPPQQVTEDYLRAFDEFLNSPEFAMLDQGGQRTVQQFAQQLVGQAQGGV